MKHLATGCAFALACAAAALPSSAGALDISLPAETATYKSSALPGYALAQQKCLVCHSAEYVNYQPPTSTPAYWKATVARMKRPFGAPVSDQEAEQIIDYLVQTYGPKP
jgi:sulfite dehydrogenase